MPRKTCTGDTESKHKTKTWVTYGLGCTLLVIGILLLVVGSPCVYDIKDLTPSERDAVVNALLKMKKVPSAYDDAFNAYDYFVDLHAKAVSPWTQAHGSGYLFFPWHREMQHRLHLELQRVSGDPKMTLPYWNWEDEASTAAIMLPSYLGAPSNYPDYIVYDGPFGKLNGTWKLEVRLPGTPEWLQVAHGNGLQMCLDERGGNYMLDTINNPPSVDSLASVGPFVYMTKNATVKDGPPKMLLGFKPRPINKNCGWDELNCLRFYDGLDNGVPLTLKCKHFAPKPQRLNCNQTKQYLPKDPTKVFLASDVKNPFQPAPAYKYALPTEFFAVCMEGNNPEDEFAAGLERLGSALHGHGSVHASIGGAMSTPFAVNNPAFGHLHGNLDRLWSIYQEKAEYAWINEWFLSGPGKDKLKTKLPLFKNPEVAVEETLSMERLPFRYKSPGRPLVDSVKEGAGVGLITFSLLVLAYGVFMCSVAGEKYFEMQHETQNPVSKNKNSWAPGVASSA